MSARAARRVAAAALAGLPLLGDAGCRTSQEPELVWTPDRYSYAAFRGERSDVLDPNYLPFMLHRAPDPAGGADLLFFCRWDDERMPLDVFVEPPDLEAVQDEFHPRPPRVYAEAVERALATWERELDGHVRFRRAERDGRADLRLLIVGGRGPEVEDGEGGLAVGAISLRDACRLEGEAGEGRLRVRFAVPELRLFVVDAHGLLTPDQLEGVALHELGHALGMRGHSPIPADLMYPTVFERGRVVDLSAEDVNSFVSLYRMPNGTVYGRVAEPPPPSAVPSGPPELAMAPHVDTRLGFALRPPAGWMRFETGHGFAAVNGTSWDYDASLQVIVAPHPTIAEYLDRYGVGHFEGRRGRRHARLVVNGRPALQVELESRDGRLVEEYLFVELGDGRVLIVIVDGPPDQFEAWRPWFQASLASLEFLTRRGWEGPAGEPVQEGR